MTPTKQEDTKPFDSVSFFRNVKEQIAKEFEGKTFEQKKELLNKYLSGELTLKAS